MSEKSIAERLQVKGERRLAVIDAPGDLDRAIGVEAARAPAGDADVVLIFIADRVAFDRAIPAIMPSLRATALLWIAYPKLTSRHAVDLSRDIIHRIAPDLGLDTVAQIALDADWSAMRMKRID